MIKHTIRIQEVLIFLLIFLFIAVGWIYLRFRISEEETLNNVVKLELNHVRTLAKVIGKNIKNKISPNMDIYKQLKDNKKLRDDLNSVLSLYSNRKLKYIYVIYRDKNGIYRYLLDGSYQKKERGRFNQIFIPVSDIWDECFKTGNATFVVQKNIHSLWITYLYPINIKGKTEAVLAFDVSTETYKKIRNVLLPLKSYIKYLVLFILMVLVITFFQFYLFIKERKFSRIDPLTHLFNRNYLNENKKNLDLNRIAVAMVDIDHFKEVNDTYGHDAGDMVLSNIAKRLMAYTRYYDIIIRYGGEEFLILFKIDDRENMPSSIIDIAQRVQRQVSESSIRIDRSTNIKVTISMGLDPYTFKRKTLDRSISVADAMLYKAKKKGRNRLEVADE